MNCDEDLSEFANWDKLGAEIKCPNCGELMDMHWEETFDGGWFYLEKHQEIKS